MLQCSGCGGLVSEFAAHCGTCGSSVDEAIEIPEAAPDHPGVVRQDEPEAADGLPTLVRRRNTGYRIAFPAVAVLVVAAAITVGALVSSARKHLPASLKNLTGEVLVQSGTGDVLRFNPVTQRVDDQPLLERGAVLHPIAVSPDGTTILNSDGSEITVNDAGVSSRPTAIGRLLSNATSPAGSSPFADGGQALLLLTRSTPGPATATLASLADDRQVNLGVVDSAAGDAQSLGAFVSVPSLPSPPKLAQPANPDVAVELRSAGRPPSVLATTQQLNRDVGRPATTPVQLAVYPNSTGTAIAVVLNPLSPTNTDVPMVILDRQGDLLAAVGAQAGPIYRTPPIWSPGGHQVAYPTHTANGIALAITTETGSAEALRTPTRSARLAPCLWSPNSADVLCQSQTPTHHQWLYATPTVDRLIPAPSAGDPLAWITAPLAP
jgi:hypothetical protein